MKHATDREIHLPLGGDQTDVLAPHVIGLIGGVASGKSFVGHCLQELGAGRLDADAAGHEVLRMPEVEAAARSRWGDGIFDAEGRIDRRALGRIVFGPGESGRAELRHLEQLTHPRIEKLLRVQALALAAAGQKRLILDAPVLLEAGWDTMCSTLVYVDSPVEKRLQRALERGWTKSDFQLREAAQLPLDVKRSRADYVVDNSGSVEQTKSEVARLWTTLFG